MKKDTTTKTGRKAHGIRIETSTPIGHEEMEAEHLAEDRGTGKTPEKLQPKRTTQDRKPLEPVQKLNPKRNQNSRPD
jgi:hypothetical protein